MGFGLVFVCLDGLHSGIKFQFRAFPGKKAPTPTCRSINLLVSWLLPVRLKMALEGEIGVCVIRGSLGSCRQGPRMYDEKVEYAFMAFAWPLK